MDDDGTREVYPAPMKGYTACPTEAELDRTFSRCATDDWTFSVKLPKGTTRRKAMEVLHHQMVTAHKFILAESGRDKVDTLRTASRLKTFKKNISDDLNEYYSTLKDVDLDLPARQKPSDEWLQAKISSMYQDIVDSAEREEAAAAAKIEADAKVKAAAEAELVKSKPEIVLANFVEKVAAGSPGSMDMDDPGTGDDNVAEAKSVIDALNNANPKNGTSGAGTERPWKRDVRKWSQRGPASRKTDIKGDNSRDRAKGAGKGKGQRPWDSGKAAKGGKGGKGNSQKGGPYGGKRNAWKE